MSVTADYDSTAISNEFAPYKGIQDSLGFWTTRRGFRIPGTGFQSLSVEFVSHCQQQDWTHSDDHISLTYDMIPGFKPFTVFFFLCVFYNLTYYNISEVNFLDQYEIPQMHLILDNNSDNNYE